MIHWRTRAISKKGYYVEFVLACETKEQIYNSIRQWCNKNWDKDELEEIEEPKLISRPKGILYFSNKHVNADPIIADKEAYDETDWKLLENIYSISVTKDLAVDISVIIPLK